LSLLQSVCNCKGRYCQKMEKRGFHDCPLKTSGSASLDGTHFYIGRGSTSLSTLRKASTNGSAVPHWPRTCMKLKYIGALLHRPSRVVRATVGLGVISIGTLPVEMT
jgi:hypothetical protein